MEKLTQAQLLEKRSELKGLEVLRDTAKGAVDESIVGFLEELYDLEQVQEFLVTELVTYKECNDRYFKLKEELDEEEGDK